MTERITRTYEVVWAVGGGVYSRDRPVEHATLDEAIEVARDFLLRQTEPWALVQIQRMETEVKARG